MEIGEIEIEPGVFVYTDHKRQTPEEMTEAVLRALAREAMEFYRARKNAVLEEINELYPIIEKMEQMKNDLDEESENRRGKWYRLPFVAVADVFKRTGSLMNRFSSEIQQKIMGQPYHDMMDGIGMAITILRQKLETLWNDYDVYHGKFVEATQRAAGVLALSRLEMADSTVIRKLYETGSILNFHAWGD